MNANAIRTAFVDGTAVTVTKTNGNTVTGTLFRVRDKSVTITDADTKVNTHISLTHVASVDAVTVDDADLLTTAEFAAIFDTNAKALRVVLRKLGLGVGRGHRYGLPCTLVTTHGDAIRAGLAA